MRAKTVMRPKGVRHRGQRLAQVLRQHVLFWDIRWHTSKSVHVIGKGEEFRGDIGYLLKSAPHHRRPRHFSEGPNMR